MPWAAMQLETHALGLLIMGCRNGLNVRNPVRHVRYFKETGRVCALTLEEVDKYLSAAKGDLKDFAILALETEARPMELLALHKNDVHLTVVLICSNVRL